MTFLAIVASYITSAFCQDHEPTWLQVATTASATYEIDARTLHFIKKDDDGAVFITVVARETTNEGVATVSQLGVAADSCDKASGRLFIGDVNGQNVHANSFSAEGTSLASEMVRQLCQVYRSKAHPTG